STARVESPMKASSCNFGPWAPRSCASPLASPTTQRRSARGNAKSRPSASPPQPRLRTSSARRPSSDARPHRRGCDALVMLELVLRGGCAVTSGGRGAADIGVAGGRIVQLGGEMRGERELDARGKLILPGGVDVHVHLSQPHRPAPDSELWVDDFHSGSLAAIAGGITTLGNMTFQWAGETLAEALARDRA